MNIQQCYQALGGSYEEVLGRLRSEALIRKFVLKFPADPSYEALHRALDAGDGEEAFRAAHTLKGISQNLGFERLYEASSSLSEALRGGGPMPGEPLVRDVDDAYSGTIAAIRSLAGEV